jgi:hypothetical protein
MPTALYPFWAEQAGAPWALGFFYAAGTIGSILVTLTSGWVKSYTKHGRAIFLAALGWGVAITIAGLVNLAISCIGRRIGYGLCSFPFSIVESIYSR